MRDYPYSFSYLFRQIEDFHTPEALWEKFLSHWLRHYSGVRCGPENYKHREASSYPGPDWPDDLYRFYALSRISQILLMPFEDWSGSYKGPRLSLDHYVEFFETLGMTHFIDRPFSPYYHEIVFVEEVEEPGVEPKIVDLIWPGLTFGQMLFSRAGVKVRCTKGLLDKYLVERSTLYFAYRRLFRTRCEDTSQGWGSNSQWRTIFHRCYEDEENFYYNVDGQWLIGHEKDGPRIRWHPQRQRFTPEQRMELLRYRCWTKTDHGEGFPFWDMHIECKG